MEDRLAKVEQALAELREENRRLRQELEELKNRQIRPDGSEPDHLTPTQRKMWRRWSVVVLVLSLVVVPVLLLTVWHTNAFWTTTISAANALVVYFLGTGGLRLLVEGAIRAVPAILLGQTTRIAVERFRNRRSAR